MKTYIGLLRAVNIAGRNAVPMRGLRALLTTLGLHDVQTLLQSGNVVFRSDASAQELEPLLEAATLKQLGVRTAYFVRAATEWKKLIAANPFPIAAVQDPGHLAVMFLRKTPAPEAVTLLRGGIRGHEMVQTHGKQAYLFYPDGFGGSRLTTAQLEKHLGPGTARNWNTVLKLASAAGLP